MIALPYSLMIGDVVTDVCKLTMNYISKYVSVPTEILILSAYRRNIDYGILKSETFLKYILILIYSNSTP